MSLERQALLFAGVDKCSSLPLWVRRPIHELPIIAIGAGRLHPEKIGIDACLWGLGNGCQVVAILPKTRISMLLGFINGVVPSDMLA